MASGTRTPSFVDATRATPNVSLQLTSAKSKEAIAVEWLASAQTSILVSRVASRSLAAELGR